MNKPNILLLMTDQQRWDAMGCSGGWVRTPYIDRLAREGIRFSNCVTNSPECMPARISLATGLYPHNTGVWQNKNFTLPAETPTWLQEIRQAGYRTSLFGKTHHYSHDRDLREQETLLHAHGLDDIDEIGGPRASAQVMSNLTARWEKKGLLEDYRHDFKGRYNAKPHLVQPSALPLEEYADIYVAERAIDYLSDYRRPEPWFCWVSFGGPHEPWDTPEPFASMYTPDSMSPALPACSGAQIRPKGLLDEMLSNGGSHLPHFEENEIEKMRANYAGNITLIDEQIGKILSTIEERGELENTIIVFTSDHGEMNGDHGLIYKSNFLDSAVRIPLIIRTPDILKSSNAGLVSDTFVEWFDIGSTLVELAGAKIKHRQFAKSLCPTLNDPDVEHRTEAISEFKDEIMYINHDWKMALNCQGEPYLLFNRKTDPNETTNLSNLPEMKKIEARLKEKIKYRLASSDYWISERS